MHGHQPLRLDLAELLVGGDEVSIGAFKIRFLSGDQDPSGVDAMRLVTVPERLADLDRSRETSHACDV